MFTEHLLCARHLVNGQRRVLLTNEQPVCTHPLTGSSLPLEAAIPGLDGYTDMGIAPLLEM